MQQQSEAWAGDFGDQYAIRSPGDVEANIAMFRKIQFILDGYGADVKSIVELGAGVGSNLMALRILYPDLNLAAVEINQKSVEKIIDMTGCVNMVYTESVLDWVPLKKYDLAFTKGLLIHIHPDDLPRAYETLYKASSRYILVAEYYAPNPTMIPYRGRDNMLWKRDFAGELMSAYPDLKLVTYGFVYKRDPYPQDDLNWFLMEKE